MAGTPETLYAKDGDSHHLAYQVVGEGPDLLFVPTATFPTDLLWDEPTVAYHLRRLASFSRLILTDLLGTGSSDAVPIHDRPAMQAWTDGLVAVLDAVGSEGVSVFAMSESALPVMLLTASHPHRVRSLALFGPFLRQQLANPLLNQRLALGIGDMIESLPFLLDNSEQFGIVDRLLAHVTSLRH